MNKIDYKIMKKNNNDAKYIYKKYTKQIINLNKHINKLQIDWVIDNDTRIKLIYKLEEIMIKLTKKYNKTIINNIEEIEKNKEIDEKIKILKIIDENKKIKLIFKQIKNELIKLCKDNGISNIKLFLTLYFDEKYKNFIDKKIINKFKYYNNIFTVLSIKIINEKDILKDNLIIKKKDSDCDGLINNTCNIILYLKNKKKIIIFEGYISEDDLNINLKISQIYFDTIINIKKNIDETIKKNIINVDNYFYHRYMNLINCNFYIIFNENEIIEKIISDYNFFKTITNKNFGYIMKNFIQSEIKIMYLYINLLLIGSKQDINNATLLFNLLSDKKINNIMLSNIIYKNLSFRLQLKLKKNSINIKNELLKLKKLVPENINIKKKIAANINMPENVKSYILEKINELKGGENNYKIQMAINGLLNFPWKPNDYKEDFKNIRESINNSRNYLQRIANKLEETIYGHENSKKILIELVGKWIQNPNSNGQVIGLVGPPGIGKNLLAKSISSAIGIPLTIIGLGGMNDSADLIGHSFTYSGAQYGMIIRQMIKAGQWRSIMFFDEVDKVSKRNETNEIFNTLLHITDPNMNQHFQDRFYSTSIEFDLSGLLIILSYNDSSKLDPILLDRITEINISPYTINEKIKIAQDYMLKDLCEHVNLKRNKIIIEDKTIKNIIEKYTLEAGVRELKRKLEKILLKLNIDRFYMRGPFKKIMFNIYQKKFNNEALVISSEKNNDEKYDIISYVKHKKNIVEDYIGEEYLNKIFNLDIDENIIVDEDLIYKYLDKPLFFSEKIQNNNMIGIVNGLYATTIGMGGILPIQIYKNYISDNTVDNKNLKLKLTGNQSKIMRESVTCALTVAINILNNEIKNNILKKFPYGFHVHAPDGGTPKDGPSAGCAFTTAFISLILNKKVNKYIAMTGEIDLTGKISKIGGLDAKIFGAKKAGIKCIYISEENNEDYQNIKKKNPEIFNQDFNIIVVDHILDIVLNDNVILDVKKEDFEKNLVENYKKNINDKKKLNI